jgi:hypothetical protein
MAGEFGGTARSGRAFRLGHPSCSPPDDAGRALGRPDDDGRLRWARAGALPLRQDPAHGRTGLTAAGLVTPSRGTERMGDDAVVEGLTR